MDRRRKVVMGLSGGMDSSTMLAYLLNMGYEVYCLNFTYGSKHNKYEIKSAELIADHYKVPYRLIDLTAAFEGFKSNLLLSGGEIPEGHYTDETMSKTVVPGRNTIFASIMMGYAESVDAGKIALGVHQGDHAIYPDCRQDYVKALDTLVYLASDRKVEVIAPFLDTDKIGICRVGLDLNVPYELTRTCYKDQEKSCGVCGSCRERLEAFEENNIDDPIPYENQEQGFQTLEGVNTALAILKDKITSETNVERILKYSEDIKKLEKQKLKLLDDEKTQFKSSSTDYDNFNSNRLNQEKIKLENELVKKTNQLDTCRKAKNRELLKVEINKIKTKLLEVEKIIEKRRNM